MVAAPGDAITSSVVATREVLRQHCDSEIFACHVHPQVADEVHLIDDYFTFPGAQDAVLIVHISIGDDLLIPAMELIPGEVILCYHNVTPAHYFAPWDSRMTRLLGLGRSWLTTLKPRVLVAFADSEFNAEDLRAIGYRDVRVGGLILDMEELAHVPPRRPFRDLEGPVVLSVGQIYPHKRPDLLVAAFHHLAGGLLPTANLVLAGPARLPRYASAIRRYIDRLALGSHVTLTGEISREELAGWYRTADIFVTASEHEGFCVPLVEAMALEVPILARGNAAIPGTIGDAGVVLPGDAGPSVLAEAMAEMLRTPSALHELRRLGSARREAFSLERCRRAFVDVIVEELLCA